MKSEGRRGQIMSKILDHVQDFGINVELPNNNCMQQGTQLNTVAFQKTYGYSLAMRMPWGHVSPGDISDSSQMQAGLSICGGLTQKTKTEPEFQSQQNGHSFILRVTLDKLLMLLSLPEKSRGVYMILGGKGFAKC